MRLGRVTVSAAYTTSKMIPERALVLARELEHRNHNLTLLPTILLSQLQRIYHHGDELSMINGQRQADFDLIVLAA
jgi:hypothetical protein